MPIGYTTERPGGTAWAVVASRSPARERSRKQARRWTERRRGEDEKGGEWDKGESQQCREVARLAPARCPWVSLGPHKYRAGRCGRVHASRSGQALTLRLNISRRAVRRDATRTTEGIVHHKALSLRSEGGCSFVLARARPLPKKPRTVGRAHISPCGGPGDAMARCERVANESLLAADLGAAIRVAKSMPPPGRVTEAPRFQEGILKGIIV